MKAVGPLGVERRNELPGAVYTYSVYTNSSRTVAP